MSDFTKTELNDAQTVILLTEAFEAAEPDFDQLMEEAALEENWTIERLDRARMVASAILANLVDDTDPLETTKEDGMSEDLVTTEPTQAFTLEELQANEARLGEALDLEDEGTPEHEAAKVAWKDSVKKINDLIAANAKPIEDKPVRALKLPSRNADGSIRKRAPKVAPMASLNLLPADLKAAVIASLKTAEKHSKTQKINWEKTAKRDGYMVKTPSSTAFWNMRFITAEEFAALIS